MAGKPIHPFRVDPLPHYPSEPEWSGGNDVPPATGDGGAAVGATTLEPVATLESVVLRGDETAFVLGEEGRLSQEPTVDDGPGEVGRLLHGNASGNASGNARAESSADAGLSGGALPERVKNAILRRRAAASDAQDGAQAGLDADPGAPVAALDVAKSPLKRSHFGLFKAQKPSGKDAKIRALKAEKAAKIKESAVKQANFKSTTVTDADIHGGAGAKASVRRSPNPLLQRAARPFPMAVFLSMLVSGACVGAFVWLTSLPPVADCQKLTNLSSDSENLYCADQAARSGREEDLLAALRLVQSWPVDHPLRNQANGMQQNWAKTLLFLARQKADNQDIEGAIALAQKIPRVTSDYAEVQEALEYWIDIRDQGRKLNAAIQAALKIANWSEADAKLVDLSKLSDNYSRQMVTRLRQQIVTEQFAARKLEDIRTLVKAAPTRIETLGQAIILAQEVEASTYVYAKAQQELKRWSKTLLGMMYNRIAKSDWAGANAVAQQLPLNLRYASEDRNALWMSRAQVVATDKLADDALWQQMWTVWTTIPQVRQVTAKSAFYDDAKTLLPRLTQQSQDLIQLEVAQTLARFRLEPALRLSAQMMTTITPQRPQRVMAQTLLAQWRKELEVVEDYPVLMAARTMIPDTAKASKPQLQAAIAQAQRVKPKRTLRNEAQTLIAQWTNQVEIIEDRPIIQQAKAAANQGKLSQAIQIASRIKPDRTLYGEAQDAIWEWVVQIQIIEDQPILDRARDLASIGSLTAAIDVASRIGPGRALYGQAQGEIAGWAQEREAIWRVRRGEPPQSPESGYGYESAPAPAAPDYSTPDYSTPAPVAEPAPRITRPSPESPELPPADSAPAQ
jgi:hypothetical protein